MSKRTEEKKRNQKVAPSDPFTLIENVVTRLFAHVSTSFDGLVVVAYRRKKGKNAGEISSTMLSTKQLTKAHQKFLRCLIEELPDAAGL